MFIDTEAERNLATKITATLTLVCLHGRNPLTDTIALGLSNGRQDGEHQLADTITRHVTAQVDHMQADTAVLELAEHGERIEGTTKHPIQLRGDHRIAGLQSG
jgi:hypothetical protein